MELAYSELTVLLTKLIPLEDHVTKYESKRDQWEQDRLNSAIKKLEAEATRIRTNERSEN